MSVLRISAQEVAAFEGVLATILHIGNIEFVTDANDADRIQVRSVRALMSAAGLVGASTVALARVLLTSEQVTRGEKIVKRLTMSQAADARDAAAKSLYGSLFRWVVGKINTFLIPRQDIANGIEIGVLDIFGFENFEVNSFEQLCINVANEQLQ
jgi:myosin-3